ncbi:AHH domain-containing protein [Aliikangiella sp. IMCC44359]|uniref:AHH domain-containing protein n=1 Tax=Aliikangiella sp. IMCC44359 TaxID=3459125 RepID=UPI00403B3470
MPRNTVVNGQIVQELSENEFRRGLYRLAGENTAKYNSLWREFEKALLDEVIKTTQAKKRGMSIEQRVFNRIRDREGRLHRQRLNANMLQRHGKKPANTDSHHLVSWNHPEAVGARAILAQFGIDIDSADNGVYLPTSSKFVPHPDMKKAPSHKKIHTETYYLNLTFLLNQAVLRGAEKQDIIDVLEEVADDLINDRFPFRKGSTFKRVRT